MAWYEGEFILHKNDPDSPVVIIGGYHKRHWTALVARMFVEFWQEHWKWIITTVLSIVAILYAGV